jgi:1-acyl-sn-glycerol-3-phosphate acyltransferase
MKDRAADPLWHITRTAAAALTRAVTGISVRYAGQPPAAEQQVFFANHTSHMDFLVLWSALPAEVRAVTRPVAAADYWSGGLRRRVAVNLFRAVLVERRVPIDQQHHGDGKGILPLLEALETGQSLVFFPEGTRGNGDAVGEFKSGLFRMCEARPGLKLVPAYLENLNRVLPKGEVLPLPLICKLVFGKPMGLQQGEGKKEFLARAHAAVCALRDAE